MAANIISRRDFLKLGGAAVGALAASTVLPEDVKASGTQLEAKVDRPLVPSAELFDHAGIQVFVDGIPQRVGDGRGFVHPNILQNEKFLASSFLPGSRVSIQSGGSLVVEEPGEYGGSLRVYNLDGTSYSTDAVGFRSVLTGTESTTKYIPDQRAVHTLRRSEVPAVVLVSYLTETVPPKYLNDDALDKYVRRTRDTIGAVTEMSSAIIMEGRNVQGEKDPFGTPEIPVGSLYQIRLGQILSSFYSQSSTLEEQAKSDAVVEKISLSIATVPSVEDPGAGLEILKNSAFKIAEFLNKFDDTALNTLISYYSESQYSSQYFTSAVRDLSLLCAVPGFEKIDQEKFGELFELLCFRAYLSKDSLNTEEALVAATKNMLVDPKTFLKGGPFWSPFLAGVVPVISESKAKLRFWPWDPKKKALEEAFEAADIRGKELQKIPEKPRVLAYLEGRFNSKGEEIFYVVVEEIDAMGNAKRVVDRKGSGSEDFNFWEEFAVDCQNIDAAQVARRFLELGIPANQLPGNFAITYDAEGKPKSRIYNAAFLEPRLVLASDPAQFKDSPELRWALPFVSGRFEFDIGGGIRNPEILFLGEGKVAALARKTFGTKNELISGRLWQPDITHLANDARRRNLSMLSTAHHSVEDMLRSIVTERLRVLVVNENGELSQQPVAKDESVGKKFLDKVMPDVTVFGVLQEDTPVVEVAGNGAIASTFRGITFNEPPRDTQTKLGRGDIVGIVEIGFTEDNVPYAVLGLSNPANLLERRYYAVPLEKIYPQDKPTLIDNLRVAELMTLAYVSAMAIPVGNSNAKSIAFKILQNIFVPFSRVPLSEQSRLDSVSFMRPAIRRILDVLLNRPIA